MEHVNVIVTNSETKKLSYIPVCNKCLRLLVASFSQQMFWFDLLQVPIRFFSREIALGQVSLRVLWFSPVMVSSQ